MCTRWNSGDGTVHLSRFTCISWLSPVTWSSYFTQAHVSCRWYHTTCWPQSPCVISWLIKRLDCCEINSIVVIIWHNEPLVIVQYTRYDVWHLLLTYCLCAWCHYNLLLWALNPNSVSFSLILTLKFLVVFFSLESFPDPWPGSLAMCRGRFSCPRCKSWWRKIGHIKLLIR